MKWWWPELLRHPATAVVMKIQQDRPDIVVEVLPPGAPLTRGAEPGASPRLHRRRQPRRVDSHVRLDRSSVQAACIVAAWFESLI
ncbi:hypothetical protein SEVIR_6G028333v4 [Setaria viridis]|uniref:Uncharacterized protein n=1 Tax=Setaria viridis TaxID=4556 RepID=A0A4U6UDH7_SETVI|nr:hypothetical protein SEVIR_6G028333v2 [Setaria viridis]